MNENKIIEADIETFLENNHFCMEEGYVAQEGNGKWFWYEGQPRPEEKNWTWYSLNPNYLILEVFHIKREKDWTKTLYRVTPEGWEKL